ncbi:hypothetical protein HMPREF1981_01027 [Bacteroides pyogenes F0041]|uniref:Uncharacterized protein n=1 Tax=Bacteroides pyogenes F0041 TaxID=1321819 RepID=U2E1S8_9BACE|nr:hypothetical protein HMPREF1981_01027 [Bacteroides pyogenes F0041]
MQPTCSELKCLKYKGVYGNRSKAVSMRSSFNNTVFDIADIFSE